MTAAEIYDGSDGEQTKAYYAELLKRGPIGFLAVNLFRAQKCSARAKKYRGGLRGKGSFKSMAYDRKQWSIDNLCQALEGHAAQLRITYGWRKDPNVLFSQEASWVLYVDLAEGQVSFHSPSRGKGPEYPGEWDGLKASPDRILAFCDRVMDRRIPDERQPDLDLAPAQ